MDKKPTELRDYVSKSWDNYHRYYCSYDYNKSEWTPKYSSQGEIIKAPYEGWFASEREAKRRCDILNKTVITMPEKKPTDDKCVIDFTGLSKEEALAKVEELYKPPVWIKDYIERVVENRKSFLNKLTDKEIIEYISYDLSWRLAHKIKYEVGEQYGHAADPVIDNIIKTLGLEDLGI